MASKPHYKERKTIPFVVALFRFGETEYTTLLALWKLFIYKEL